MIPARSGRRRFPSYVMSNPYMYGVSELWLIICIMHNAFRNTSLFMVAMCGDNMPVGNTNSHLDRR